MRDLVPFFGLCVMITLTPGLDTAVVVRRVLRGGRAAGVRTALGCAVGLFVHAVAVALGLAELLLRSEMAFEAVKIAGALLLVFLGVRSLWSAWRRPPAHTFLTAREQPTEPRHRGTDFVQGLLTNLTNPKATVFFMASLPQFVPADRPAQAVPIALGLAVIAVLFSVTGLGLTAFGVCTGPADCCTHRECAGRRRPSSAPPWSPWACGSRPSSGPARSGRTDGPDHPA